MKTAHFGSSVVIGNYFEFAIADMYPEQCGTSTCGSAPTGDDYDEFIGAYFQGYLNTGGMTCAKVAEAGGCVNPLQNWLCGASCRGGGPYVECESTDETVIAWGIEEYESNCAYYINMGYYDHVGACTDDAPNWVTDTNI